MDALATAHILITGGTGMIGRYIDVGIKADSNTCNILDAEAVEAFFKKHKPKVIIHLAAATDTAQCENDMHYAYRLNVTGTLNVCLAARSIDAKLVYVSTSRVFSGENALSYSERDIPAPVSVYGKSKYLGEQIVATIMPQYLIARGCWLFGGGPAHDTKFFGSVLAQLKNETIVALDDVSGSPTYAKDFVAELLHHIALETTGIIHICNSGIATRAAIADFMITNSGSRARLHTVQRDYFETGYLLPTSEAMSSQKCQLRGWEEALCEYMEQEWGIIHQSTLV